MEDPSEPNWPTPMGMAGIDRTGKNGAGGEFAKMAVQWPTPMSGSNTKSERAMRASTQDGRRSGGGQSSPPGLEQIARLMLGDAVILPDEMAPAARALVDAALPTYEDGGAAWPTPNAALINDSESPESFRARQGRWKGTYHNSVPLEVAAKESSSPTGPRLPEEASGPMSSPSDPTSPPQSLWPTPMSRDGDARRGPSQPNLGHLQRKATDGAVNAAGMPSDDLSSAAAYWPTPRAVSGGPEAGDRKKELLRDASGGGDLQAAASQWPTPVSGDSRGGSASARAKEQGFRELSEEAQAWPTPTSTDHKGSTRPGQRVGQMSEAAEQRFQTPRAGAKGPAGEDSTHGGQPRGKRLNPAFVEWLMGFPTGWTNLTSLASTDFARWVTRSFRLSRALLSWNWQQSSRTTSDDERSDAP